MHGPRGIAENLPDRPLVLPDSHRKFCPAAALESLEGKRGVIWVVLPELGVFPGKPLHMGRQLCLKPLESRRASSIHAPGQSRSVPVVRAFSASSKRKSSFPAAASSSICWSQAALSRSRINAASSASSSTESSSTALLISARLIPGAYAATCSNATTFAPFAPRGRIYLVSDGRSGVTVSNSRSRNAKWGDAISDTSMVRCCSAGWDSSPDQQP